MPVIMPLCNKRYFYPASRWLSGLCLLLFATTVSAASRSVENTGEHLYLVPENQVPSLSRYLSETVFPENNKNVRRSRFTSHQEFFDFEDLFLLHRGSYIAVKTTSDNDGQKLRQVIAFSNHQASGFSGRGTGKVLTADDKHPLLSQVKRVDRDRFKEQLDSVGVSNIFAMRPVIITDAEHHGYIFSITGMDHLTVSLNIINIHILGRSKVMVTLSILPQSEQGRKVAGEIENSLEDLFPGLHSSDSTAYQLAFENGPGNPAITEFFLSHRLLFKLLQALLFAGLGTLVILLIIKRRSRTIETIDRPA